MAYVDTLAITSATSEGLIVASNASVPEASARVVYVLEGGVASNATVSTGGNIYASNGGLVSDGVASAGAITARNGGTVSNVNVEGAARAFIYSGGVWSGGVISGTGENDNYDTLGGGIMRGVTIKAGTVVGARFAGNLADTIRVEGGGLHIQRGGSGANITQVGGNVYISGSGAARSYVSGLYIQGGTCALNALADVENVTVTGGQLNVSAVKVKNLSVTGAGHFTLAVAGYYLFGNVNFAAGTLTNDADAHAVNGTIYDLNLGMNGYYGHGITLSNYTHTGGTCYVIDDAVVDGGLVTAGTMQALNNVSANGAVIKNVTFTGGTMIVRGATNRIESSIFKNGTFYIQEGAQGADLTIEGGTFNCAGGSLTGGTITGGTVNFNNGFTVTNVTMTGGTANANATLTMNTTTLLGLNVNGGTVTVNAASLLKDANIAAGTVTIKNGGILDGCDVSGTGKLTLEGGFKLRGDIDFAAGALTNDADVYAVDGTIYNFDLNILTNFGHGITVRNFTQTGNTTGNLIDDGVADGGLVTNGTFQALDNNGANGAVIRNFVYDGGVMIVRGATNRVESTTFKSGTYHIQSGASGADLTLEGGTLNAHGLANAHSYISGATVTGGLLNLGTCVDVHDVSITGAGRMTFGGGTWLYGNINFEAGTLTNDADAYAVNGRISDLTMNVTGIYGSGITLRNFTVTAGDNVLSAGAAVESATVSGGALALRGDATAANVIQTSGRVYVSGTAVLTGGAITGGELDVYDADGAAKLNDFTVSGGTVIVRHTGNEANRLTVSGGNTFIQEEATLNTATLVGGQLDVAVGAVANSITQSRGSLVISNGGVANNLLIQYGTARVYSTAVVNGGVVSGLLHISSGGVANDVVLENRGDTTNRFYVSAGGRANRSIVRGGEMYVYNEAGGAYADDVQVSGGLLIVRHSGNSAQKIAVSGGTLHVQNGASASDIDVRAGSMYISGSGANDTLAKADTIRISGGALNVSTFASASNVVLSAGNIYSYKATLTDLTVLGGVANIYPSTGEGLLSGGTLRGGQTIIRYVGNSGREIAVSGGELHVQRGADASDVILTGGTLCISGSGGNISEVERVVVSGGSVTVNTDGVLKNINMTGGSVSAYNTGVISAAAGNTLYNAHTSGNAKLCFVKDGDHATLVGADTKIAEGTLWYEGTTQLSGHGENGVISGLGAGTAAYKLSIGSDIVLKNATGNNTEVRISAFNGAKIDGMLLGAGAIIGRLGDSVEFDNVTLSAGHGGTCNLNLSGGGQTATNTTIGGSGAKIQIWGTDAKIENTTLLAGGSMVLHSAGIDTGKLVTIDFSGTTGDQFVDITNLSRLAADTELVVRGVESGNTYTFTRGTTATDKTLDLGKYRVFDMKVAAGGKYTNGFLGVSYDFTTGKALTTTNVTVGTQTAAAELDNTNATVLADGGLATKWTTATDVSTLPAAVAGAATTGDAWLTLDGANLATPLYGADGTFNHDVNMWLYEGTVRNLAAGATAGGSVANVNLLVSDNGEDNTGLTFSGVAYAGGFGTVAGEINTAIYAGTFQKDFYAGALANKLDTATGVGDVTTTVSGGVYSGNIYGASAVKTTSATSGTRHTAENVTLTVTDGETTKGSQACIFAGGYATGEGSGRVYTVTSVTAEIAGGNWGTAAGGRGVFGGIMASGVEAAAGDISLTISGGTMGNVYGGGWAQKTNGKSIVGDVNLTITSGTIANVFGGGSHSTSGGTTTAGAVTITVAGGSITGDIYARGQLEGDTTGAASVIFTGAANYGCGVYGYSYVGGAGEGAALSFYDYKGSFSGAIGGFDGITLDGDTAMTLTTAAADVANGAWEFDLSARADALAGTSLLAWNNADFAGDKVAVTFANDAQAAAGWNIADADFTGASFDLYVGGDKIAEGIAYDTAIDGGDWAGWKFTSVDGTLKFAQITA